MIHIRLLLLLALSLTPAMAHEIARDGTVAALIHTDPDDAPGSPRRPPCSSN